MPKIEISIIIPVYNTEPYLGICMQSIYEQSFKDWEVLFIDDNSSDASITLCKNYALKDDRIKLYHNYSNKGPGECRNIGIMNAKGKYLTFVDSDDFIEKDYLQTLYDIIENNSVTAVVCECEIFTTNPPSCINAQTNNNITIYYNDGSDKYNIVYGNAPWRRIIRRDFIIENNLLFGKAERGEDSAWNSLCKWLMSSYAYIPQKLYFYRKGHTSLMTKNNNTRYIFEQEVINYSYLYQYLHDCKVLFMQDTIVYIQLSTLQHLIKNAFRVGLSASEKHYYYKLLSGMRFPLIIERHFAKLSFRNRLLALTYNQNIPYRLRYMFTWILSLIKR